MANATAPNDTADQLGESGKLPLYKKRVGSMVWLALKLSKEGSFYTL